MWRDSAQVIAIRNRTGRPASHQRSPIKSKRLPEHIFRHLGEADDPNDKSQAESRPRDTYRSGRG